MNSDQNRPVLRWLVSLKLRPFPTTLITMLLLNWVAWSYHIPSGIYLILAIALFLLLTALFNYLNLAAGLANHGEPQPVPDGKFTNTLRYLEEEATKVKTFGFETVDCFYLKRVYEVIVCRLANRDKTLYWSFVSFVNRLTYCEVFTEFESGCLLSTSSAPSSGNLPRPPHFYLQGLPGADYQFLLEAHRDALDVFAAYGHHPRPISPEELKSQGMKRERDVIEHVMAIPLWPIKMTAWSLFKAGKKYQMTLRDQLAAGTIQIPSV